MLYAGVDYHKGWSLDQRRVLQLASSERWAVRIHAMSRSKTWRVPVANVLRGPKGWNQSWSLMSESGMAVERLSASANALGLADVAFAED